MPLPAAIRDVYLQPGPMTALGRHAAAVAPLPGDVAGVCDAVQGLVLHQFWAQAYGTDVGPNRAEQQHIRGAADMLDALIDNRPGPLGERREPGDRFVGVCRHFSVLSTAILRAHGVPARCRVGFGAYFDPKTRVDHWVVEHWDDGQDRWVLTDSQIDALQKAALKPDFDPLETPRDRFIIAGDAWRECRAGRDDPMRYGIFDMHGLWFIAGNVLRDFASLNNVEMLPWDAWGVSPKPDEPMTDEHLALFDHLAALTLDADARFAEIWRTYDDDRYRVPETVFNVVANRMERLELSAPA